MTPEILNMVLQFLHVTYDLDHASSARIQNEIDAGMEYLKRYFNSGATFEPGTLSGQYLCEYVLRAESGALETFSADFAQDIAQGRIKVEVDEYAEAKGYVETP